MNVIIKNLIHAACVVHRVVEKGDHPRKYTNSLLIIEDRILDALSQVLDTKRAAVEAFHSFKAFEADVDVAESYLTAMSIIYYNKSYDDRYPILPAGTVSPVDVARARVLLTSIKEEQGDLVLFAWEEVTGERYDASEQEVALWLTKEIDKTTNVVLAVTKQILSNWYNTRVLPNLNTN